MTLDPRLNAYRPDLADARLSGQVDSSRFVPGETVEVADAVTAVRGAPSAEAMMTTQALLGERIAVFERKDGWAWGQLARDGYVGYVSEQALTSHLSTPTHSVAVPLTFIFPRDDIKSQPPRPVYFSTALEVAELDGKWARLAAGGFVIARHLRTLAAHMRDAATVAEMYEHVPYLWGGKTHAGLDCSGLTQLALQASGLECPRDTDMMERTLGEPLPDGVQGGLRRGDLVFWKGHVGMMLDETRLIHANGFHMSTMVEPLAEAVARIAANHGPVTSVRRL